MIEPVWIDERDALTLHAPMLALHGGPAGLRDEHSLKSALTLHVGGNVVELAALYTAAIVQNHPFVDGNMRTGFIIGILFLEMNVHRFTATQEDAANAVLNLAAGKLDEAAYTVFLRANSVAHQAAC